MLVLARETTAAALLRSARTQAGLTQQALARRAEVPQSVISAYESGAREPALTTLTALVDATGRDLVIDVVERCGPEPTLTGPLGTRLRRRRARALAILRRHGATHPRVFGSVARNEDRPDSDIDLLVHLTPGTGLLAIARLQRDLEAALGAPVDVVPDDSLKAGTRHHILAEAIAL